MNFLDTQLPDAMEDLTLIYALYKFTTHQSFVVFSLVIRSISIKNKLNLNISPYLYSHTTVVVGII
jgi:hypothetical protein